LKTEIDQDSALEISKRARGTPRIALKFLKRVRDFAQIKANNLINLDITRQALSLENIDELGLTHSDRDFLITLINKHNGGPVGLSTIAATLNEDPLTVEEVIEPYLMQIGFMKKTPQGRVISPKAYQHLKLPMTSS